MDVHSRFCLFSIVFLGYYYAVIRINVVEFIANPSRNWTFQLVEMNSHQETPAVVSDALCMIIQSKSKSV